MRWLTRVVSFVLGMVIFVDALLDDPTQWVSLVIALVLMGVISLDQLADDLARRKGRERQDRR